MLRLAVSTAYLVEGLHTALQTPAGRRLGHPILATVQARPGVGVDIGYFEDVERAARPIAGVTGTAWAAPLPGNQPTWQSFRIESHQIPVREVALDMAWFTAESFQLFAPRPTAGRMFGGADRNCPVAVVNLEAAQELFGADTVGRTIQDFAGLPVEIVGVVGMQKAMRSAKRSRPTIYYNYTDRTAPPCPVARARFRATVVSELAAAELDANVVSPSYFDAMGLSLLAGQGFDHPVPGECRIGVIDQEAAGLYFAGQAVGAAVIDGRGRRTRIVGIVHSPPLGPFQQRVEPAIYFPTSQDAPSTMTLIVGARDGSGPILTKMLTDLRRRIESVPGRGPAPIVIKTLEAHLTQTALAPLRIAAMIVGPSAATALASFCRETIESK
ncbi:MAG TPA: ABC transporter permease [Bryobacteraceae bacterium]|nr:ABC transporter permease [Bryobacteraceae bacterium]